eukprot:gene36097-43773_t
MVADREVEDYPSLRHHVATVAAEPEHRISCHRCGNIRKRKVICGRLLCPHIYCGRCADKMRSEYGAEIFKDGCPVCKELCCCSSKNVMCHRLNHCYRKCPATKAQRIASSDDSSEGDVAVAGRCTGSASVGFLSTTSLGKRGCQYRTTVEDGKECKQLRPCLSPKELRPNSSLDWFLWPYTQESPNCKSNSPSVISTYTCSLPSSLCSFYPPSQLVPNSPPICGSEGKLGEGVERLTMLALVSSFALEQAGVHC